MTKSMATFSINTDILNAARKMGLNMSAICEKALAAAASYSGDPEAIKAGLDKREHMLQAEINMVHADKERMEKASMEKASLLANPEIVRVLIAWRDQKCMWTGVSNIFKRQAGFAPSETYVNELIGMLPDEENP